MRRLWVLLMILGVLAAVPSCAEEGRDPFAYADTAFSVTVEGTYLPAGDAEGTPRPFAAQITAGAPVDGDPTLRDLTVTFIAPDTLAGLTVTAALSSTPEGAVGRIASLSYPSDYGHVELTAEGAELDGLLRFGEALLPLGDVVEVSPTASDGSRSITRRAGEREATFSFVAGRDLPVGVRLTDGRGVVEMVVGG